MNRDFKWVYERTGEEMWRTCDEEYNTVEEAIEAGREYFKQAKEDEYEDFEEDFFSVGQIIPFVPSVCADHILDTISELAYDECGEIADNYLERVSEKDYSLLEEMMNKTLKKWIEKTDNLPRFWKIRNIADIPLEDDHNE